MSQEIPGRKRRLVLHIGTHRTGTTAIQLVCHNHRARLRELGWLYPETGTGEGQRVYGHHRLAKAHARDGDPRPRWAEVLDECRSQPDLNVLISSEEFCKIESEAGLALLRSQLSEFEVRVLVYLRRQDHYAQALYSIGVMIGNEHRPIRMYLRNLKRVLDYEALLQRWATAFGEESLIVRIYERERFPNQNVVQDLMQAIGCPLEPDARGPSLSVNRTYPRVAIQSVLRLRNLGLPPDTVRSAVQLVRNVYRDSSMPHDLLSPAEAHRLWLQYEPGNEKVARRYFPGQESLFVPPVLPTPEEEEEWVQSLPEDDQALKFLFSKAAAAISGKPAPGKPEEKRPARGETPSKREQKRPAVASTAVRHDEQRIVFVHIPKTAGMSLYYALQKWAGEDRSLRYERGTMDDQKQFMQFPVERLDTMKVVSGHFNHSVFRRRCGEAWSYISILRDPVDRFVSMYTYIGGWKGHPFHAQAVNRSFAQFYEWLITSPHNSNTQIKMLTGTENLDDARRVASAYRLIGSVAHMPVFEHELGQLLGKQIEIGAHNQSRKPTTEVVVEPAVREKIEQLNAADRTLYDWVSSERAIVNG